jgi:cell division protease FtsH
MDKLHRMADALIKYETIDESQIRDIMDGRDPKPPEGWEDPHLPNSGSKPRERGGDAPSGRPAEQH